MNKINSNIMNSINLKMKQLIGAKCLVLGILFLFLSIDVSATHIVGGDFTYTKLDDGRFEIKLTIRRDCFNGEEDFDSVATISIYDEDGGPFSIPGQFPGGFFKIPYMGSDTIDEVLISDCGFLGEQVCVHEANYIDTISLNPAYGHGFIIAYERCCRNISLNNIVNPLESGMTEYIEIPYLALTEGNSSPRFNSWPDLYICANEDLVFDHSATDPDGDELRYKLCLPYDGADFNDPLPQTLIEFPLTPVDYLAPYNLTNLMGGVPLEIDSLTGVITANPNLVGQFLIGICVEEYRDGVKIGETRRDFEYNVRVCEAAPVAAFDNVEAQCDGNREVTFNNQSTGSTVYIWNFDYPSTDPAFQSSEENPTFVFPEEGTYTVVLQAYRGSDSCFDEYIQNVTVTTADIDPDFNVRIGDCLDDNVLTLALTNTSIDNNTDYIIESAEWTVDQNGSVQTVSGLNSTADVDLDGGDVIVTLVVTSSSGCTAEISKTIVPGDLTADTDFSIMLDGCPSPELVQFTLTDLSGTVNPDFTAVNWNWTITSIEGTEMYTGPSVTATLDPMQVITVSLVVQFDNNCTAAVTKEINLQDILPKADFSAEVVSCLEDGLASFLLSDISNAIPDNPSNSIAWEWIVTLDNGEVLNSDTKDITFITSPYQNANISLVVQFENGCEASINKDINLEDLLPDAGYTLTPENCPDDNTVSIVIDDASTNNTTAMPQTIKWSVGPISNIQMFMGSSISLDIPKDSLIYITQIVEFSNGCVDTLMEQIIPGPFATLNFAGDPVLACVGGETALLVNPNPDFTYTFSPETGLDFSNGQHDPFFVGTVDMTYDVTVSDGVCTVSGSVDVTLVESATLEIDGEEFSCDGQVNLTATGGVGEGDYIWSLSSDPNTAIFTGDNLITTFDGASETYLVNYTNDGCPAVAASFTVSQLAVDIDLFDPFQMCRGDSIQFEVINNDLTQTLTYEWEDNIHISAGNDSSMPVIEVGENETDPFELPFMVTNQLGCTLLDTLHVVIADMPILSFNSTLTECGELEVCFDIPVQFFGFAIWDFGDPTTTDDTALDPAPCYTYPDYGTYTVTLSNISGICQAEPVTMDIVINPQIEIEEIANQSICAGDEVTLTASANLDESAYTAVWCDVDGNALFTGNEYIFTPTGDIDVVLKVSDVNGCNDSQTISINTFDFDLEVDFPEVFCGDSEVPVTVTNNSDGDLTYQWGPEDCVISGGDTANPVLTASGDNKVFTLTVTNAETGCSMDFTYDIPVTDFDVSVDADPDTTINEGEEVDIFVVGGQDGDMYEWSNGNTNDIQTVMPLDTTTYTVTVTDENGCTDTAEVTINVRKPRCDESDVYIPNSFSPNADGVNDLLYVRSNFTTEITLVIYDRWGEEVFRTTDQNIPWDGTHEGEKLAPDAYAYILDVICVNDISYTKRGNVSIIR